MPVILDHNEFIRGIETFYNEAEPALRKAASLDELELVRARYLGKNQGWLKDISARLGQLEKQHRATGGAKFNETRQRLESLYEERRHELRPAAPADRFDRTMPARRSWRGSLHPVSLVIDEITGIFRQLGFTIALGPEAETEWYNFGALNFPPDHPAMELHDTLYLEGGGLLRTHTSPVQVRTLQSYPPPVRILAPGNVYRRDFFDSTHSPTFAQIEGLAIDEGVNFADLKATLTHFARQFYGPTRRTRFRPSYFPFTEPSAEMDVETDLGDGRGLRWIEILGCGLVHPAVLENTGVDSERYTGWAFGMGPGRIAQSRHGIPDCRVLFDSDVRFLEQFAR
ncbi:MAG TPA: phenylalanine--tRNA ligase subunit alpha [Gemmatimonadaceae bacterium]|nr:phenylalanine--tRNA ligase subunit alpha [Gemmatimonadaceae bacterium]